jgi:hypothetical protein
MHLYLMRGTKMSDAKSMIIIFSSVNLNLFLGGALWNFLYWFLADVLNSVIHQKVFQFTNKFSSASRQMQVLTSEVVIPEDEKFVEPAEPSRAVKIISKLFNNSKNSKIVKQISKLLTSSKQSSAVKAISKIFQPAKNISKLANSKLAKTDRRSKPAKAPPELDDPDGKRRLSEVLKDLSNKSRDR